MYTRNWEALLRLMEKVQAVGSCNSHKSSHITMKLPSWPEWNGSWAKKQLRVGLYVYARKTIWNSGKCTALDLKSARIPLGDTHTRPSKARLKPLFGHRRRLRVLRVRVSKQRVFWNRFGSVRFSSVRFWPFISAVLSRRPLSRLLAISRIQMRKKTSVSSCLCVSVSVSESGRVCVCLSVSRACVRHWRQPAMYK